jgi:hypothetical protein
MFGWMRRKPGEPPPLVDVDQVEFLGPATVPIDPRFPAALARAFESRPEVRAAYLARIRYVARGVEDTALCLVGTPSDAALDDVEAIFFALFPRSTHLDAFFVAEEEAARLAAACEPFFRGAPEP